MQHDSVDTSAIMRAIYGDGFMAKQGAFDRAWVARLGRELEAILHDALQRPGGTLNRGPNRYYVEIRPEDITGFAELASHPWIDAVARAVLGPSYRIVELGFDVPGPGSAYQPWHRDFAAPEATLQERRIDSLAFNLTTVDVTPDMGPFEIAPGTQWDEPDGFKHGMFPPERLYERYERLAEKKLPKMGDVSARSALTIHRGTPNVSTVPRPALVLGMDAASAHNSIRHDLQLTRRYYESLPVELRRHLACRVVETLETIQQAHVINELVEGACAPDMYGPEAIPVSIGMTTLSSTC